MQSPGPCRVPLLSMSCVKGSISTKAVVIFLSLTSRSRVWKCVYTVMGKKKWEMSSSVRLVGTVRVGGQIVEDSQGISSEHSLSQAVPHVSRWLLCSCNVPNLSRFCSVFQVFHAEPAKPVHAFPES